jgi:hypothetical protein
LLDGETASRSRFMVNPIKPPLCPIGFSPGGYYYGSFCSVNHIGSNSRSKSFEDILQGPCIVGEDIVIKYIRPYLTNVIIVRQTDLCEDIHNVIIAIYLRLIDPCRN